MKIFCGKKVKISIIPPLIPSQPNKETLGKLSNRRKNPNKDSKKTGSSNLILYANVVGTNIKDILKLKNNFPNLLAKKIEEIHKMVKDQNKYRVRINMMTKRLSCCQIIIPICTESTTKIMAKSSKYVTNINHLLKNIKLNIVANFIWADSNNIIVTTNIIAA